jgi:probable DNA repair protein
MQAAALTKQELFARLAGGHAARATVVTPNQRLAQELGREFYASQIGRGLAVWEDADILPLAAFVERLREDALFSETTPAPHLLTPVQERQLWQAAIAASAWSDALLSPAQAAAQAMDAWRLAHAWRIDGALEKFPGSEDSAAFAAWAKDYAARCGADTDSARLPDLVAGLLAERALRKPQLLVAYGFDILPPQARDFLQACAAQGIELRECGPRKRNAIPMRAAFASAREELEAAASWARARLESFVPSPSQGEGQGGGTAGGGTALRIGIVIPDLPKRRREVVRVFSRLMQPGCNLPGASKEPMPFNVSLGVPLADTPIVHAALAILELAVGEIDFALASRVLRSPFLGGAESELARRARLDAELRRTLPARVTLARLIAAAKPCALLREKLEALYNCAEANRARARSPHQCAAHFTALLEAAGFPGERALDSDEYQARAKLHEMLGELAKLERIVPAMDRADARAHLERLCAETLFQPESPEASVQVLGILESAGLEFDALWVSGLTDEAWPLHARPNPFIAVALQKKAGIPQASAEGSIALDRRITDGWLAAADEVIVSHALREEDRNLLPSPLIATIAERKPELPQFPRYRDALFAARRLESTADGIAPRFADKRVRGGTRVLADQSACPFRAFARHRLGAQALEAPAAGLDDLERGTLLHALMAGVWGELKCKATLYSLAPADLAAAIGRAAASAVARLRERRPGVLEGRFAELERARLEHLARDWLELEKGREDFEVVAREDQRTLTAGGLEFSGRIDRMDRLSAGKDSAAHLLIDYKTGRQLSPRAWMGERPTEPQLALYAVNAPEEVAAVAYAKVRRGEMRFMGYSREADAVPGLTRYDNWDDLIAGWKKELDTLAQGFASGAAQVDPKEGLNTCRQCDLQPLCRVHERIGALQADAESEAGQ